MYLKLALYIYIENSENKVDIDYKDKTQDFKIWFSS